MFKKGILLDVALFVGIVLLLLIVTPIISSILKQLIILQAIVAIVGAFALRYLVQKIRTKWRNR